MATTKKAAAKAPAKKAAPRKAAAKTAAKTQAPDGMVWSEQYQDWVPHDSMRARTETA